MKFSDPATKDYFQLIILETHVFQSTISQVSVWAFSRKKCASTSRTYRSLLSLLFQNQSQIQTPNLPAHIRVTHRTRVLHALARIPDLLRSRVSGVKPVVVRDRSEEHTSELQS